MCYSTALRKQREKIEKKLRDSIAAKFHPSVEYTPYYHLNGFTHGNLQIIKMNEPNVIYNASWGLVPDWAIHNPEGFRKKSNTLNARGESIYEKPSFRESAEEKRCLILADGFFEPHHENGKAIPYFCYQPTHEDKTGQLFLFAGLYNEIDETNFTATILTTNANEFFAEVHNKRKRMPLVLDEHYYEDWLDNGLSEPEINEIIATGMSSKPFKAHAVSRDFYKKGIDTNKPYIIEEVQKDTLF
ncbi:MAG: SOS response-associated peptidase [Winogradskyella sp.]|uniref:SOS response-associated peptidase n=1 Tax=Winogradskyella sp. TaxID=1883156 RepID=UPI000F3FCC8E|nr:SOS response-associated peptidase [Winogradskyella sp.]RNC88381.1 MAG: SOS response-associated peptidase [Winogradskyella sp.]